MKRPTKQRVVITLTSGGGADKVKLSLKFFPDMDFRGPPKTAVERATQLMFAALCKNIVSRKSGKGGAE